jgi:hypothetical protein
MYGITHAFAAQWVACELAPTALVDLSYSLLADVQEGTWDCVRVRVGKAMSCGNCKE